MELLENHIYSTKEMQEFFKISKDNWKKKKDNLLLHLSNYYLYDVHYNEKDRRKIDYHIIQKIKDYEPPQGKKERQNVIYSKKILEVIEIDNLQTPKNVSRIIKNDKEIVALRHKDGTIYEYTRVNMQAMFGKKVLEGGSKGIITEKIWCKADFETNIYVPLTPEQIQYLYDSFHSFKDESNPDELSIYADYENGLITHEEMTEAISENGLFCFLNAKDKFKAKYNYFPIKVPVYVLSAF